MLAPLEEINLEDDIRQNIYHCLITEKGERALRPEYGCEISKYFYQLNKSGMARNMCSEIKNSLTKNEPRITVNSVDYANDEISQKRVMINYTINELNSSSTFEFPLVVLS